jgi:hypothetical protein
MVGVAGDRRVPAIDDRPLPTITWGDILSMLTKISTVKPETARRLKERIKVVLVWAKASGFRNGVDERLWF